MKTLRNFIYELYNMLLMLLAKRTVGVRALVIRENRDILLVKHTYLPGWHTIGGGVDPKESPLTSLERELQEEAGIQITKTPQLFGFYLNRKQNRDDYVALYVCTEFTEGPFESNEIEEAKWFPLNALPKETAPATRRRLQEYLGQEPSRDQW